MKNLFLLATLLFGSSLAHATVQGNEVTYTSVDTTLKGYIAYDDAIRGSGPVYWWFMNGGVTMAIRASARMLAELGYIALALDMYGEGKEAHHPDEAAKFSAELAKNLPLAKARFESAMKFLQQQECGRQKYRRAGLLFRW